MGLGQKEDLEALAVCTVFLFLKMLFAGVYTAFGRRKDGRPAAPEDTFVTKNSSSEAGDMGTFDRGQAMHRNDLENIPIFLLIAILLLISGSASSKNSVVAHIIYYAVFSFARLVHSFCVVFALQPWRSIAWATGVAATMAAAIHLLVQVFTQY